MDYEEIMADVPEMPEVDDLSIQEITEEPEEQAESLDSVMGEETEAEQTDEQTETPPAREEPGYVKGRIEKAVQKVRAEYDQQIADLKASFEAQMAPIRERMLEDQAQELVRNRKIADIETAREFVRMKNGQQPVAAQTAPKPVEQPRQENGQFAPRNDPETEARISMLEHQAQVIMDDTGIDVTVEFMNNPEIKKKVVHGEMDFYDVAKLMQSQQRRRPPSPMRSPNGASGQNPNAIANMTDEQFDRMDRNIKERGARYELK